MYRWILILAVAAIIGGCAKADTVGPETKKTYNTTVKNSDSGIINMFTYMPIVAETKTTAGQTTDNDPTTRNNANASLAGQGGQSALAAEGASQMVEGVFEMIEGLSESVKKKNEEVKKEDPGTIHIEPEASKPVARKEVTPVKVTNEIGILSSRVRFKPIGDDGKLVILTPSSFGRDPGITILNIPERGRYTGGSNNDSGGPRATYRFSKPGSAYPKNLKLKIKDKVYLVPDPSLNYNRVPGRVTK